MPSSSLAEVFHEIHEHFQPTIEGACEMLHAVGLMAHLFLFLPGEESWVETPAGRYRSLHRGSAPHGRSAEGFAGRWAHGE